jgi:hypothetical protein
LFDTGLIIQVLDALELERDVNFSVLNCDVRSNTSAGAKPSRFLIQLSGDNPANVKKVAESIRNMVINHPEAEGTVNIHAEVGFLLCFAFVSFYFLPYFVFL